MENKSFTLTAPSGAVFISKWMTEIPVNCVFNKGVTGCGATTLAITQPGNTIIAMPYVGLVDNKVASNPDLLGIHGDMDREWAILNYLKTHDTIKIAVVYDSLPFVCIALVKHGLNPYRDFFLFVDEWHILFNSYKLRNRAARNLLDYAEKFERKTYVSATPIPREYWLDELKHLPEYKIEWPEAETVTLRSNKVASPLDYVARLCKARLSKGGDDNYHIFLNSVDGILRIIRLAGLSPDDCRIVCSQSGDSMVKNEKKLGSYRIQKTTDPVKMFNFYTSTCFEGQDILDENGRTFIVSEAYKDYTMMDVMTTLPQICGRIRDSKYRTEINHYYATSKYKDVTQEEFEANLWKQVEDAEHDAEVLNNLTQGGKDLLKHYIHRYPYVDEIDGKIIVDRNLASIEIVNYGVINGQYQNQINMNAALQKAGFQVTNDSAPSCMDIELENPVSIPRTPFKKIFEEYAEIRSETGMYNLGIFRAQRIEIEKPLVKKAYEILGPECVRELKYHQGSIKREIIKREHETLLTKIFLLLDGQLEKQVAIPKTEVRKKLDAVYQELGIKEKAKSTDLKDLYYYKDTTKRGADGKPQACVCILSAKIKAGNK